MNYHLPLTTPPLADHARPAFTLVEMLIAITLTLLLVTAIAEFYAIVGDSVKDSRAMIELSGHVRAVVNRLDADLESVTAPVMPWLDDGASVGYFEVFEGRGNDYDADGDGNADSRDADADGVPDLIAAGVTTAIGDADDMLAFTIRAKGRPLNGRYVSGGSITIIASNFAEVIWWTGFKDLDIDGVWDFDEPRFIYRRQLLIRPDIGQINSDYTDLATAHNALMSFLQANDISASVRAELNVSGGVTYRIRANSLSDLSRRECRFGHMPQQATVLAGGILSDTTFPHSAVTLNSTYRLLLPCFAAQSPGVGVSQSTYALQGDAFGEDVMLSDVLAFDVQVYDPHAKQWPDATGVTALLPSDPGYSTAATAGTASTMIGMGGFVDLGFYRYLTSAATNKDTSLQTGSGFPLPQFGAIPTMSTTVQTNIGYLNYPYGMTYDTWALSYERDGIDQFGDNIYDRATNGNDDDGINGVDDVGERETTPPYADPIRGLRVRIRVYEPSTRQVRQATVAADFVTE